MSIYHPANHYAAITAFYALNLPEFRMPTHTHPDCEIMYIVGGSCRVLTETEEYTLKDRQFIFLDAGQPHQLLVSQETPCSILNIEFSCTEQPSRLDLSEVRSESASFASFLIHPQPYFVGTDSESLGYALKDLISRLQKNNSDDIYLIRLLFFRVLLELSLCYKKNRSAGSVIYLKKACEYISSHLTEEIRIPQIAAHADVNKSYLHALFSKYMNCTITDYINRCRLNQAAFLLTNSSLSVTDIAFRSGYNSRQHFSATFEKFYHMTPRTYRQLNLKTLNTSTKNAQIRIQQDELLTEDLFPDE